MQATLTALQGKGDLGTQYIQLLIAEQLKDNSKWIISGGTGETVPVVELRTTP